jgi:hypothetical protein
LAEHGGKDLHHLPVAVIGDLQLAPHALEKGPAAANP